MKKLFTVLLIVGLCMYGCTEVITKEEQVRRQEAQWDHNWKTISIDGCEYITHRRRVDGGMTHKGNCSNPIHYHNQPKK